jgi:DivIVA domain-containing protein
MDEDDPEKRIAELERRLTDARAARGPGANQGPSQGMVPPPPGGGWLTPEHVRNKVFAKPRIGQRGYNENEVDDFLDLVEAALQDPTARTLTAEQVHNKAFSNPPRGKRGYNEEEVDAFLDLVAQHIRSQQGAFPPPPQSGPPPPQLSTEERLQKLETLRGTGLISDAEYAAKREQIIGEI